MTVDLIRSFIYPLLHNFKILGLKRSPTMDQLVQENTKRPNINSVIITFLKSHLRCHILISTAKGCSRHSNLISRPSKITELNIQILIE